MTCSRNESRADAALRRIVTLLDENRMRREIDEPIDAVLSALSFQVAQPVSQSRFHEVLIDLMQRVYRDGIRPPLILSRDQAGAEAIALLETGYGRHGDGYDLALADAVNPRHDGVGVVVLHLVELIKQDARRKYVACVYATCLGPLDWPARCGVAELLLNRLGPFLPPELSRCVPAQLADEVPRLIEMLQSSEAILHSRHLGN